MAALTTRPLEDGFETELSQAWDGSTGTIYIASAPNFTFPAGETTYISVNPGKSNYQVAEINAYDGSALTMTVSNITLEKGASVNSTAQSHAVGSKVIISDNYQFWKDIDVAIDAKIDTADGALTAYADATARDAAITSPANGMQCYLTDTGKFTDYTGGSWVDRESGGTFANASTTVAGKVEIATSAETQAGTDTGGSAELIAAPSDIAANIQSGTFLYAADGESSDAYIISLTPNLTAYATGQLVRFKATTANDGACTINIDSLGVKNIKDRDGDDPQAGAIAAGEIVELIYDGTNFVLQKEVHGIIGEIVMYGGASAPTGWFLCDATEKSMTTYEALYDIIENSYGLDSGTACTFTNATNVVDDVAHGLSNGAVIEFTTDDTLPTGLSADQKYYVVNKNDDDFQVSLTSGGAAVTFSDDGTGNHKYHVNIKLPDLRGNVPVGKDAGTFSALGGTGGEETHDLTVSEIPAHTHTLASGGSGGNGGGAFNTGTSGATGSAGGGDPHNNLQPYLVVNYIIKY